MVNKKCFCSIASAFIFVSILPGMLSSSITFNNLASTIVIKKTDSKLVLQKADEVVGWSEFSITKKFGNDGASSWTGNYYDGVVISQEGSEDPTTQLIISNSNALNYGIKNNSNAVMNLLVGGSIDDEQQLLEDVRATSNALLYCCKNTSNSLIYGLKNNSNAIVALLPGAFSEAEKFEIIEDVRTTSNGFLYCCKNTSNALAYGIKNNSNALVDLLEGEFTVEERAELVEHVRATSNAFLYCCKNTSNTLAYWVKNNSNTIYALTPCGSISRGEYGEYDVRGGYHENAHAHAPCTRDKDKCENAAVSTAQWHPDNTYLAVVANIKDCDFVGQEVRVYKDAITRDGTSSTLALIAQERMPEKQKINSIAWSTQGNYLGVSFANTSKREKELFVYEFDEANETLRLLPEDITVLMKMFV